MKASKMLGEDAIYQAEPLADGRIRLQHISDPTLIKTGLTLIVTRTKTNSVAAMRYFTLLEDEMPSIAPYGGVDFAKDSIGIILTPTSNEAWEDRCGFRNAHAIVTMG